MMRSMLLKERFYDVTKFLTHIILTLTKSKERDELKTTKKQMENFDFVFMLVVQCKIFQIVNYSFESHAAVTNPHKNEDLHTSAREKLQGLRSSNTTTK